MNDKQEEDNEENKDEEEDVKRATTTKDIDTQGADMIEKLDAIV